MKYIKVMCGRFTLDLTTKFYERFKVANRLDGLKARYNIAPTQDVPVIVRIKSLISCGTTPHSLPSGTHTSCKGVMRREDMAFELDREFGLSEVIQTVTEFLESLPLVTPCMEMLLSWASVL